MYTEVVIALCYQVIFLYDKNILNCFIFIIIFVCSYTCVCAYMSVATHIHVWEGAEFNLSCHLPFFEKAHLTDIEFAKQATLADL